GKVPALCTGSAHGAPRGGARTIDSGREQSERGSVEPLAHRMRCASVRVADHVRAATGKAVRVAYAQPGWVPAGGDGQWQSGISVDDAGELPSAKQMPREALLVRVPGQFVDKVGVEDVAPVELRGTIFRSDVIRVLWSAKIALRRCQTVRKGVVHDDQRIAPEALQKGLPGHLLGGWEFSGIVY